MEKHLQKIYSINPQTTIINLDFKEKPQEKELENIFQILQTFTQLIEIDIQGENFTQFPPDAGLRLQNLQILDLSKSNITINKDLAQKIQSFQNLKMLYLDVSTQNYQYLFQKLKSQIKFNGLQIINNNHEQIQNKQEQTQLFEYTIKEKPQIQQKVQKSPEIKPIQQFQPSPHYQFNFNTNEQFISNGNEQQHNLKPYNILKSDHSQKQKNNEINLLNLNISGIQNNSIILLQNNEINQNQNQNQNQQQQIQQQQNDKNEDSIQQVQDRLIDREGLLDVSNLYDKIRQLYQEKNMKSDKKLEQNFEKKSSVILNDLKKNKEILFNTNNNLNKEKEFDSYTVKTQENILEVNALYCLFGICYEKSLQYLNTVDQKAQKIFENLLEQHTKIISQITNLSKNLIKSNQNLQSTIKSLQQREQNDENDLKKLLNHMKLTQKDLPTLQHWRQENYELQEQIQQLKKENQQYLQIIIDRQKKFPLNNQQNTANNLEKQQLNTENTKNKTVQSIKLPQLKELVNEMYQKKQIHDQKMYENNKPLQTMEQYMYTYLTEKYGLQTIVINQANAIIEGLQKFGQYDNQIRVFTLVMKNEIDEDFHKVQNQVQKTLVQVFKTFISGQNKHKSAEFLEQLYLEKMSGYIKREEYIEVLNYMYGQSQSQYLIQKIDSILNRELIQNQKIDTIRNKHSKREQQQQNYNQIEFYKFQNEVLDYQLQVYCQQIRPFLLIFKSKDTNYDGVLDQNELIQLVEEIDLEDEQLQQNVLEIFTNTITFSQCLKYFGSTYLSQHYYEQKISVLQMICEKLTI